MTTRRTSTGRPHLGVGVPSPLRPGPNGGLSWARLEVAVERSILDILETEPGERVMLPDYGAGLGRFLFAPNSPVTHREIEARVTGALRQHEHRVRVEGVTVQADPERPNAALIDIDYVVQRTNSAYNLVYPFYLSEGT